MTAATDRRAVLVVDDDADLVGALARALRDAGHDVATAGDGFEAANAATHAACDLVLLDLRIPYRNGVEVLRILRSHDGTAALPVWVLTVAGDEAFAERAMREGADGVLDKSELDPAALAARVLEILAAPRRASEPLRASERSPGAAGSVESEPVTAALRAPAAAAGPVTMSVTSPVTKAVTTPVARAAAGRASAAECATGPVHSSKPSCAASAGAAATAGRAAGRITMAGDAGDVTGSVVPSAVEEIARRFQKWRPGGPELPVATPAATATPPTLPPRRPGRSSSLGCGTVTAEVPPADVAGARSPDASGGASAGVSAARSSADASAAPGARAARPHHGAPPGSCDVVLSRLGGQFAPLAKALGLAPDAACPTCGGAFVLRLEADPRVERGARGRFLCPRCG